MWANKQKWIFFSSLILPYTILVGLVVRANIPLVTGRPVLLDIEPVDPRDLMRGQYVQLAYDFSTLELQKFPHQLTAGREYRFGDTLYLLLKEADGENAARPYSLKDTKPNAGLYLQVTPTENFTYPEEQKSPLPTIFLKAGIESFYTDELMAPEIEAQSRRRQLAARVFISPGGEARLVAVVARPGNQSERTNSSNAPSPSASP